MTQGPDSPRGWIGRPTTCNEVDMTPLVETVARIIDPSKWAVLDSYLADMLRKYKGEHIGYDPEPFKDKASMAKAQAAIAVIRAHLEPTSEMVEAVMDCGPIGCCNISSTEARDIILSALKASPIGDVG